MDSKIKQIWVEKTSNGSLGTFPELFSGSHVLTAQKPVSVCYVIEWFIGTIALRM